MAWEAGSMGYAVCLVMPRWEQFGYVTHKTVEAAEVEALYWINKGDCSAAEIMDLAANKLVKKVVK